MQPEDNVEPYSTHPEKWCPDCNRIVTYVVGNDDEPYCPCCDRRSVEYMMGREWTEKAIKDSRPFVQEPQE